MAAAGIPRDLIIMYLHVASMSSKSMDSFPINGTSIRLEVVRRMHDNPKPTKKESLSAHINIPYHDNGMFLVIITVDHNRLLVTPIAIPITSNRSNYVCSTSI
mmetsp:Transcript_7915/g.14907  ORF Transcript_7915/g.14907 Transcript_7915/m.14907 type:complete len:103 (-) Transcript_7915:22-330(-)